MARNPYSLRGSGYYVGEKGADQYAAALKAAAGNLRDLREVHSEIADIAKTDVQRNVPVYMRRNSLADRSKWRATSRSGKRPGYLKSTVKAGSSPMRSWVSMVDPTGVLILQEFGGKSYWHGAGRGALRAVNRAHWGVASMGGGYIGTTRGGRWGYKVRGHIVYAKPRKARGYFIWNVAWHMRQQIADTYCRGLARVANKHGIEFEIARSPELQGMKPATYRRAA